MSNFDDNENRYVGIGREFGRMPQQTGARNMTKEYDNTNRMALFLNDKKGNEKAPDYKGKINIEGKEYPISAWKKFMKKGEMISGSIDTKQKTKQEAGYSQSAQSLNNDFDDSIPF